MSISLFTKLVPGTNLTANMPMLAMNRNLNENIPTWCRSVNIEAQVNLCKNRPLTSFAIILTRTRELVALLKLSSWCLVTVNALWFFLAVPWVGLQCVIVFFPDHTHFLSEFRCLNVGLRLRLNPIVSVREQ